MTDVLKFHMNVPWYRSFVIYYAVYSVCPFNMKTQICFARVLVCMCKSALQVCVCVCARAHKSALQVCVCVSVCVLGRLFRMLTFSQSSCFQACNPLLTSLVSVTLSPESLSELQWRISPFSLRFSFCVRLSCDLFPFSLSVLFLFLSSRNGSHYYVYCYLSYSLCHYEFIYFWSLYYNFESLERDRN